MISWLKSWNYSRLSLHFGVSPYCFAYIVWLHYSEWADKGLENLFFSIMDWKPIHVGNSLGKEDGSKRMEQRVLSLGAEQGERLQKQEVG